MQFYAKLNDNKSIKEFSNTQQAGYQAVTIDDAMAEFLAPDYNLIWVDDNGLAHTDNLPITKQQKAMADQQAKLDDDKKQVDQDLATMQGKLDEANKANAQLDDKIKQVNNTIGLVQMQFAKEVAALNEVVAKTKAAVNNEATKPAESAQPVQQAPASSSSEKPAKPAEPAQSAQPTKPASSESVKPAESSVNSSEPAQPAKPANEQHK